MNEYLKFDDFTNDLLDERREHTKKLESTMGKVHEIMKDCSEISKSQGDLLDRIDSEVSSVSSNTKLATKELEKSQSTQKIKRGCCILILLFSSIILLGVIVVGLVLGRV